MQDRGDFGAAEIGAAMRTPFDAAIAWVGSGPTAILAVSEQFAERVFAHEQAEPAALGRGMTAYAAGVAAGARLRGHELGPGDDERLLDAVGTAVRRGPQRVVAEHCDLSAVAAAERTCAATLSLGFSDPAGRLASALHRLYEEGLAVGLTLAA